MERLQYVIGRQVYFFLGSFPLTACCLSVRQAMGSKLLNVRRCSLKSPPLPRPPLS